MRLTPIYLTVIFLSTALVQAGDTRISSSYGKLPLHFEPNRGQFAPADAFRAKAPGYDFAIAKDGSAELRLTSGARTARVGLAIGGARPAHPAGTEPQEGHSNYVQGNEPTRWVQGVPHFGAVKIPGVRPGVDVIYHADGAQLEYDFEIAPHADPSALRLRFSGAAPQLDADGAIRLKTEAGDVIQHKPAAWQTIAGKRREIPVSYALEKDGAARFQLGDYNPAQPLIIDPILSYATYFGGSITDEILAMAVDASGYAVVVGYTNSPDLPATNGSLKAANHNNMFVAKLNPSGTALSYCSYIGGSIGDYATGVALDATGNAYIAGMTVSLDFPTLPAVTLTGSNQMILKLNTSGLLTASRSYSGAHDFTPSRPALAMGADGNLYLTATSHNLTTTAGAYSATAAPASTGDTAYAVKLDTNLNTLWATYLGGTFQPAAIAVDGSGSAYLTGSAVGSTSGFPATAGAYQTTPTSSTYNGFVLKLNPAGTSVTYATYLGLAYGNAIAVDSSGDAYVGGTIQQYPFPVTAGAFRTTPGSGGFVAKLNPAGSALLFSTYMDYVLALALSPNGVYVAGYKYLNNIPTTPGSLQPTVIGSAGSFFLTELSLTGDSALYSTVLGTSGSYLPSEATALAYQSNGLYIAGYVNKNAMPVTAGAFSATPAGGFVAKIDMSSPTLCSASLSPTSFTAAPTGDSGSVSLTLADGCPWFVTPDSFLHVTGAAKGVGSATIAFTVDSNVSASPSPRSGHLNLTAGSLAATPPDLTVTQQSFSCATGTVSPSSLAFDASGGTKTVQVTLATGCPLNVSGLYSWIGIYRSSSSGSGIVSVFALANSYAARSANITVAGQGVTITQAAGPCSITLPGSFTASGLGDTGAMSVVASAPSCPWIAYASVPWIQLSQGNGPIVPTSTGSGLQPFTVAPNPGSGSRTGQIQVVDQVYTVTQKPGPAGASNALTYRRNVLGGDAYSYYAPSQLALDPAGNLYVWDPGLFKQIFRIDTNGVETPFAGHGGADPGNGGPATQASLYAITGLAADSAGNVYLAEAALNRIRKVDSTGILSLVAGAGTAGYSGDGAPATQAALSGPTSIAASASGALYISDTGNNVIRKISSGAISTVAGNGRPGFAGDGGLATAASLSSPQGIAVDTLGRVFFADTGNCRIRLIAATGQISTVAGNGTCAQSGGGSIPATGSSLSPSLGDITVDGFGTLFFLEGGAVKRLGTDGILTSIALGVTGAVGIAVDSFSNLYVDDAYQLSKATPDSTFCTYTVTNAPSQPYSGASTLTVQIATQPLCSWSATSTLPWVTFTGTGSGTGSGSLTLNLAANTTGAQRSGTIAVAGQPVSVSQGISKTNSTAFVTSLYSDLLNRAADTGGLNFWSSNIDNGNFTRDFVALQFFNSPEFTGTGLYLIKLYVAILGRDPDFSGWNYWFTTYRAGLPLTTILNSFLSGPEFQTTYGGLTNAQFVNLVYQNVLGRAPDSGGQTYWLNLLNTNQLTRAAMMDSFIRGTEFDNLVKPRAYANLLYMGFLRRNADTAGLAYWSGILRDLTQLQAAVNGFISGPEYNARF